MNDLKSTFISLPKEKNIKLRRIPVNKLNGPFFKNIISYIAKKNSKNI